MPFVFKPNSIQHLQFNCAPAGINVVLNRSTSLVNYSDVDISLDMLSTFQCVTVSSSHQPASMFSLSTEDDAGTGFSFGKISVDIVFKHL